jgi:hypothetical protein
LNTEISDLEDLNISPNPVSDFLRIKVNKDSKYEIFSSMGLKLKTGSLDQGSNSIDLRELTNGVYFIKVNQKSNMFFILH